jgi:hypothetical protein
VSAFTDIELELEKSRHLFLAAFDLRDPVDDLKLELTFDNRSTVNSNRVFLIHRISSV